MKVLRPLMPTASPTGSQQAPEAARSLSISRSESTTTPEASARGFLVNRTTQGLRTSDRFFAAQVSEIRHLLTPHQHSKQKPRRKAWAFFLVGACRVNAWAAAGAQRPRGCAPSRASCARRLDRSSL